MIDYDNLITKLQELTTLAKPEYKEGWFVSGDKPRMIKCYADKEGYALHPDEEASHSVAWGKIMYPTKSALIEAQIEMWQKLKDEL